MFGGRVNQMCLLCDFQVDSHDSLDRCHSKGKLSIIKCRDLNEILSNFFKRSDIQKGMNI